MRTVNCKISKWKSKGNRIFLKYGGQVNSLEIIRELIKRSRDNLLANSSFINFHSWLVCSEMDILIIFIRLYFLVNNFKVFIKNYKGSYHLSHLLFFFENPSKLI